MVKTRKISEALNANTVVISTSGKETNALHMEKHALRVEKLTILQQSVPRIHEEEAFSEI